MRVQPLPSDSAADLMQHAWRLLLAATAERRRSGRVADLKTGAGADAAWLTRPAPGAAAVAAHAPSAVRPLLELYSPLCDAAADRPLTIAHLGQSLDGHIATGSGDSYYVTGPDNVRHLHRLRALCDAVVVGAGTVARDDPQLTVRHVEGPNPVRVILDPRGQLPAKHRVFTDGVAPTLVVRAEGVQAAAPAGVETLPVPVADGRLDLRALLAKLHARRLFAVFVEGGGATVSRFLEAGLLDRLHVAIAPLVTGTGRPGLTLPARDRIADCLRPQHRVFTMGEDVLFDCDLRASAAAAAPAGDETISRVI
jgi:diaminohydroxyphosphoribosylaminopyrimidine deaminase / 5-amino-6-(5-phosphoribosylamino)uracil reductase